MHARTPGCADGIPHSIVTIAAAIGIPRGTVSMGTAVAAPSLSHAAFTKRSERCTETPAHHSDRNARASMACCAVHTMFSPRPARTSHRRPVIHSQNSTDIPHSTVIHRARPPCAHRPTETHVLHAERDCHHLRRTSAVRRPHRREAVAAQRRHAHHRHERRDNDARALRARMQLARHRSVIEAERTNCRELARAAETCCRPIAS
jgi:hypothetical protein